MSTKQQGRVILFYWLPVLIWCACIYSLSSVPNLRSDFPGNLDLILRKFCHIGEYAILTFFFYRAAAQSMGKKRALGYAALFTFTFAFTDEYHQSLVTGRNGNLVDVTIDSLGVFLSVFLIDKRYLDASMKKAK